jgi:hypothetical protein
MSLFLLLLHSLPGNLHSSLASHTRLLGLFTREHCLGTSEDSVHSRRICSAGHVCGCPPSGLYKDTSFEDCIRLYWTFDAPTAPGLDPCLSPCALHLTPLPHHLAINSLTFNLTLDSLYLHSLQYHGLRSAQTSLIIGIIRKSQKLGQGTKTSSRPINHHNASRE